MDQEVKSRWVARLRSGQDLQGRNRLKDASGAKCCLGVLADELGVPCELNSSVFKNVYVYHFSEDVSNDVYRPLGRSGAVPDGFAGLSCKNIDDLVGLNDDYGKNFNEIADWIEENL